MAINILMCNKGHSIKINILELCAMTVVTADNLMQWHDRAKALYGELPVIDARTQAGCQATINALIGFYAQYVLSNNGIFPEDLTPFLEASDEEFVSLLSERLAQEDPLGHLAPKYMKRKAENLQSTYWMSFHHLATSLIEESHARAAVYKRQGREVSYQNITTEILSQQLMAYEYLDKIARDVEDRNFSALSQDEIDRNEEMLAVLSTKLNQSAAKLGITSEESAADIHARVTKTWGMLTTNQTLITPDFNYRTHSMRVPGAARSLFPYPHLPMHAHSSPVANYITYAEVPQASRITKEDTLSFGFLNAVHFDPKTGEGFVIEHPHYMYSTEMMMLAAEVPDAFDAVFGSAMQSRQNHDLLHHMVQVFGDHFQIHHPSAPISRNGYSPDYLSFGRDMRAHRETYELTAVAGQADLFAFRYDDGSNPAFFQHELDLMRKTYDGIANVKRYLLDAGRVEEAQRFTDYGCRALLGMYAFILAPGTAERDELDNKINVLSPSPVNVQLHSVVSMLDAQGFLDIPLDRKVAVISAVLESNSDAAKLPNIVKYKNLGSDTSDKKYTEYVNGAFYSALSLHDPSEIEEFYRSADLTKEYPEAEYGSEILASMLSDMNLLQDASAFPIKLKGAESVRWVLLGGNNKPGLKGLAEKGHYMEAAPFSKNGQASVFDMIVMQEDALNAGDEVYKNRIAVNQQSQQAAHAILGLFSFTHSEGGNTMPEIIADAYQAGVEREAIQRAVGIFDDLVEGIFSDEITHLSPKHDAAFDLLKRIVEAQGSRTNDVEKNIEQIDNAVLAYRNLTVLLRSPQKNALDFSAHL